MCIYNVCQVKCDLLFSLNIFSLFFKQQRCLELLLQHHKCSMYLNVAFSITAKVVTGNWLQHLATLNREVALVRRNGFCLLNSIITALYRDHDVVFYEQVLIDVIRAHVKNKGEQYLHLHPGTKMELVADVDYFFNTVNYDQEIADILLLIATDAIHLNITLYWHSSRDLTIHELRHKEGALLIFLQFLEHPENPIGNH